MIIQSRIQRRALQNRGPSGAIGVWSVAVLCGSIIAACSGTIETPTEEFPPRATGSRTAASAADDDNDTPARPPAAANDDDEDVVAPPAAEDDEEAPPAAAADDDELPAAPPEEEEPPAASGDVSFANDIQPIFSSGCAPCHTTSGIVHNIGSDDLEQALDDALTFEEEVIAEIETGEMPPDCGSPPGSGGSCISEEDFQAIQDWYAAGAPE